VRDTSETYAEMSVKAWPYLREFFKEDIWTIYTMVDGGRGPSIPLPRQDQLQEMCKWAGGNVHAFFGGFWTWYLKEIHAPYIGQFNSAEQILLAFVMDGYGKVWNGEDWICTTSPTPK
jgi:hypothetical protein